MIQVIKHDMDPNSNINYRRKIAPMSIEIEKTNSASLRLNRKLKLNKS